MLFPTFLPDYWSGRGKPSPCIIYHIATENLWGWFFLRIMPSQLTFSKTTQTCVHRQTYSLSSGMETVCSHPSLVDWKDQPKCSLTIYTIQLHIVFSWFQHLNYFSNKVTTLIMHTLFPATYWSSVISWSFSLHL